MHYQQNPFPQNSVVYPTANDFHQPDGDDSSVDTSRHRSYLRSAIAKHRLLGELDSDIRSDLEQNLELISLDGGEILFRVGDVSDALYFVLNGYLEVDTTAAQNISQMAYKPIQVGIGQIVGELGVISGKPRSATISAKRYTMLGRLTAENYLNLVQRYPKQLLHLISDQIISDYQNKSFQQNVRLRQACTIALLALDKNVPLADFAEQLTNALSQYGTVLHIDSTHVHRVHRHEEALHRKPNFDDPSQLKLWLAEQEANYDYLIFSTSMQPQADNDSGINTQLDLDQHRGLEQYWATHVVKQADQLLYIAWAESDVLGAYPCGRPEQAIAPHNRSALVLLHPPERKIPVGTRRWLTAQTCDRHHHIRWHGNCLRNHSTTNADMERLSRLVTGQGIGLVLSGGGARGYAHVGVLRALAEANIPIDLVGGTSMGAVIAALFAIGHHADSISELLVEQMGHRRKLVDLTLPITSLLTGQKLGKIMRTYFDDIDIVDTWYRFFCVSTDITRAAEAIHRSGPLWRYVRASMSMPFAFPPQVDGNRLLIDGCLVNNYPANIMHSSDGCGTIIGVNVCLNRELVSKGFSGESLSGWEVLSSKLNPFQDVLSVPNAVEILNRLLDLNSTDRSEEQRRITDIYIRPSVEAFGAQGFHEHVAIIDAGYRAAQQALQRGCDESGVPTKGAKSNLGYQTPVFIQSRV